MRRITDDDRKLVCLAAVATGKNLRFICGRIYLDPEMETPWEPPWDDGDALRLAIDLEISPASSKEQGSSGVYCNALGGFTCLQLKVEHIGNPYSATRRVIVLTAAELGKRILKRDSLANDKFNNMFQNSTEPIQLKV